MDWISGDTIVDGVRLRWTRTGGSGRPVVLAHGFSSSGLCWTRAARELERDYDVVMYDARGHGLSDAPDTGYSTEERARELVGLIEALDLDEPAAIGHSMGAGTVAAVASMPDVLACAVLEDPVWRDDPPPDSEQAKLAEQVREVNRKRLERMRTMTRDELIEMGRNELSAWHPDELPMWADSQMQLSDMIPMAELLAGRKPWREVAAAVTVPALLLAPDMTRPGFLTQEAAEEAQRIQPLFRAATIPGTGHEIRRENLPAFMAAVRDFLKDVYAPL